MLIVVHSLVCNQPILKFYNSRGHLLSRSRPLQTTTGLLSNIPRLEYGIRALFRSQEASYYDFYLQPCISMDWKVTMPESSHKLNNFKAISSTIKSFFNTFNNIYQQIYEQSSKFGSLLKSISLKFAKFILPSGITIFFILLYSWFISRSTHNTESKMTGIENADSSCHHSTSALTI